MSDSILQPIIDAHNAVVAECGAAKKVSRAFDVEGHNLMATNFRIRAEALLFCIKLFDEAIGTVQESLEQVA